MLKKMILPGLLAVTLAAPVAAFDIGAMSDEERAEFGAQVRTYLLENPQVIMEAVNALEEQRAAAQAEADLSLVSDNADALFNDGFSWVGGNPDGDITVVEFMDYRCGFCKRAVNEVETLLKNDGNIRFIVKEFPILGEESVLASRFAMATKDVAGDEAYKSIHDALMAYGGPVDIASLRRVAEPFDLDLDAIEARMGSEEISEKIRANRALAQRLQIGGTPTFVMGDQLVRGFVEYDQMQMLVDDLRG
ncbi:DsbA family protein [Roseobacter ponti]|uniref:DsbA family protein n=1 Tax=Roseobacter ponti TaxID=1891787 RepID=A0A858T098_9RHOB|nr:DsbA family protein [Roseobacter ponti]QJF53181.1 DsbA family protein [Roseobacter ponti]